MTERRGGILLAIYWAGMCGLTLVVALVVSESDPTFAVWGGVAAGVTACVAIRSALQIRTAKHSEQS
jgi:hypothetical protein